MSSIRGTISVDVAFTDSTTVDGAQSLNTVTLRDATEYTSGKVAIVTGTVGTAAVTVWSGPFSPIAYLDSSGSPVTIGSVGRVVLFASPQAVVGGTGPWGGVGLSSVSNQIAIGQVPSVAQIGGSLTVRSVLGTASYTLVLYGT